MVSESDRAVTFAYKDSSTGARRTRTLDPFTFLHKFLQHVLPRGFTRVRYYGFLAPGCRDKLRRVRDLLGAGAGLLGGGRAPAENEEAATGPRAPRCPSCSRPMELVETVPRARAPPLCPPATYAYPKSKTHAA